MTVNYRKFYVNFFTVYTFQLQIHVMTMYKDEPRLRCGTQSYSIPWILFHLYRLADLNNYVNVYIYFDLTLCRSTHWMCSSKYLFIQHSQLACICSLHWKLACSMNRCLCALVFTCVHAPPAYKTACKYEQIKQLVKLCSQYNYVC